jgi:anthranilate synthase component 1
MAAHPQDLRRLAYADPMAFPVLFDSAASGPLGRYSILPAYPEAALWQDGYGRLQGWGLTKPIAAERGFLSALEELWRGSASPAASAADEMLSGPFQGGWVVYLGYELSAEIEPKLGLPSLPPERSLPPSSAPRAFALRVPAAMVYDHLEDRAWTVVEPGREALQHRLRRDLATAADLPGAELPDAVLDSLRLEEEDPQRFAACVAAALEHIRAGDIYQANLSRRWYAALDPALASTARGLAGRTLYERLRRLNPAPFAALARFQGWQLLCSSPERLVRVSGSRVETRPIAGTRPRSRSADADSGELAALIAHPKERAEHIMLVDLERNDLGRICRPGSVRADELMCTESYAHVHHIVSNVCGELGHGLTSGRRAARRVSGRQHHRLPEVSLHADHYGAGRGGRAGPIPARSAIINRDGSMDFNILIRTITMDAQALDFRAGAGIVADSDWRLELQETRAKARGLIAALQCPEPDPSHEHDNLDQRPRGRSSGQRGSGSAVRRRAVRDHQLPRRSAALAGAASAASARRLRAAAAALRCL